MRLSMGGAESNVAIGVARFGVPATWIGRLGDDPIGDLIDCQLLAVPGAGGRRGHPLRGR
jgi:2-dehydro-3-deoxygluconokinase